MAPILPNAIFQGMFPCVTLALMMGAISDRGRAIPALIFVFVWATIVYNPIACWTWNSNGWIYTMGSLDYAGGTPVHIASGFGALAYSFALGRRAGYGTETLDYRPHSVMLVVIGTAFLWVGWFGFNSGSTLAPNLRAAMALLNTQVSASFGGLTWALLDYRLEGKWSVVGFCSGIVAGLVCVTPGAGFIPPWAAVIFGICGGILCNFATKLKYYLNVDDSLDVFAVHGVGGLIGNVLTGIFAANYIANLDGVTKIDGGWINGHYVQLGYQIAGSLAGAGYSFVVTFLILIIISRIPGLHLRVSTEEEALGLDVAEHDEYAYDYVELMPDLPLPGSDMVNELTSVNETGSDSVIDPFSMGRQPNARRNRHDPRLENIEGQNIHSSDSDLDPNDPLSKKDNDTEQHENTDLATGPIKTVYPLLDRSSSQESL